MTRRAQSLALAGVVALACAPYARSLAFGFTFDDANTILDHRGVTGPFSLTDLLLRDFWGRSFVDTVGSYRPVVTLGYWLEWHLGGGRAWPFHADNLVLYAALLALYALFLGRFFGPRLGRTARLVAVAVAGTLAIHADVVPSPTGRAEILAALFGTGALIAPLREGGPLRARDVALSTVLGVLAACAKESALTVGLLAPVLAYRWHSSRGTVRRGPMLALAASNATALAGVVAFRVLRMPWWDLGPDRATENALLAASPGQRLLGVGEVLVRYLEHLVWPARLAPDYSYAGIVTGHAPLDAAVGLVLTGLLLAVGVAFWRRGPGLSDAALGLAASYAVVSNALTPASAIADRLFFFPSFWLVTLAALAVERLAPRAREAAGVAALLFVCAQGSVAAVDGGRWSDDVALFTSAIEERPTVVRSRRNLAQALAGVGRLEDAAWQMVVANALLDRYPEPVPDDAFPATWDQQPVRDRLGALRRRIGDAALDGAIRHAAVMFRHWGNDDVAALLDDWARPA